MISEESLITHSTLKLSDYRSLISLDEPSNIRSIAAWEALLGPVLRELGASVPNDISTQEGLYSLHGMLAPIDAFQLSAALVEKIEVIAAGANERRGRIDPLTLASIGAQYESNYPPADITSIWVGDITQLGADAIVNAANSQMLGCRQANHACIDNAIHSAAGPRLRDDCELIIERQHTSEQIGEAKITRGYALPAPYVLHTVGPYLHPGSQATAHQREQLTQAYRSCLDTASQIEAIRTVAFCAISTGIFSYPKKQAAEIAMTTVARWLSAQPDRFDRIIFNLYSAADASVYEEVLKERDWSCL